MKITELVLQTNKLRDLEHFYGTVLGMDVRSENEDHFTIITPGTKLVFTQTDTGEPFYHFAFNVPSNRITEAREWLKQRAKLLWMEDYQSDVADFVNWHARSVYFIDPAGNVVEFIARFDLGDMIEESFTSKHIRNVSEIGVVFPSDDYDRDVQRLLKSYALSYFAKQPPLAQFRAIGDDEGLFIVVPANRPWFPTRHIVSSMFPITMEFQSNGISSGIVM